MKKKTLVYIFGFFILCIALLAYGQFNDSGGEYFSWRSGDMKDSVVQITTGKPATVHFELRVGDATSEMLFEIKDESAGTKGIFLEDTTVQVRNGKASSKLIFDFHSGDGTKAGYYAVTIIAKDAVSGKSLWKGEIPFAVDMLDLIWRCSC
jgi:hypothetical protein